jgi:Cu2+-exporting ATPase
MPASATLIDPAPAPPATGCYHCGLPLPTDRRFTVVIDGAERAMCCGGCQAVAQTIAANDLTAYYRYRSALPAPEQKTLPRLSDVAAFAIPEVEAGVAQSASAHAREAELMLVAFTCPACIWLIEQRLRHLRVCSRWMSTM